jgi:hypothetical protein
MIQGLTSYHINFIRAICSGVYSDFVSKANISRIKESLLDKEFIETDADSVYLEDPIFQDVV